MGEQVIEDKPSETPEDTGEVSEAPSAPDPGQVMQDAIAADPKLSEDGAAPEGKPDEDAQDAQVAPGADDTTIAPVDDPVIKALTESPDFKGHTFKTKEEFFKSVGEMRNHMSRRDEDAVLGREMRGDLDAFRKFQQNQQDEEKGRSAWSPPPMPIGMHAELQKADADRDPVKVEDYNKRLRYINDRQTAWAEDPDLQLREHTLPAVERLVGEMFAMEKRRTHLEAVMEPNKDFIDKHGAEIQGIMDEGAPLELAIELAQSRQGTKTAGATDARKADVATMASGKGRARASVPAPRSAVEVDVNDAHAVMLEALAEQGVVDPDPMALD